MSVVLSAARRAQRRSFTRLAINRRQTFLSLQEDLQTDQKYQHKIFRKQVRLWIRKLKTANDHPAATKIGLPEQVTENPRPSRTNPSRKARIDPGTARCWPTLAPV
jgi:hypothetical protein